MSKASEIKVEEFALQNLEFVFDKNVKRNFQRRLRKLGFKRSIHGEAYYHPKHWKNAHLSFGKNDPGDTWSYEDAFKAITTEAKKWLKKVLSITPLCYFQGHQLE